MGKFIRHIPCPTCGSRDNMGEYEDNFYCFGCGYYRPKRGVEALRARLKRDSEVKPDAASIIVTKDIPLLPKKWLLRYEITDSEIENYGIGWCEDKNLLILIQNSGYWQGRYFGNQERPKYLSSGNKDLLTFFGEGDSLVVVEDVLSAIKVARLSPEYCSLPLMGSTMPPEWARKLSERFKQVRIWLDRDKAKESLRMARNLSERGIKSSSVITDLDPKEYSKNQIREILSD